MYFVKLFCCFQWKIDRVATVMLPFCSLLVVFPGAALTVLACFTFTGPSTTKPPLIFGSRHSSDKMDESTFIWLVWPSRITIPIMFKNIFLNVCMINNFGSVLGFHLMFNVKVFAHWFGNFRMRFIFSKFVILKISHAQKPCTLSPMYIN